MAAVKKGKSRAGEGIQGHRFGVEGILLGPMREMLEGE